MIEKPMLMNAAASRPIQPHVHVDRDWAFNARAEFAKELTKVHEYHPESVLLTPHQTVVRACDIAEAFFKEVEQRQWLLPIPLYDAAVKELSDTVSPTGFMGKSS